MTETTVRKVDKEWIAQDGTYIASASTKREALASLRRRHAMAAVDLPELRAIQQRWALAIEAIIPGLDPTDAYAMVGLNMLKSSIKSFEHAARSQALMIEEDIKRVRARMIAAARDEILLERNSS